MDAMIQSTRVRRIRELNDAFRRSFAGGHVLVTSGVSALPPETSDALVESVKAFTQFDADNDPHSANDFGAIEIEGERYFWKIDYYDPSMDGGSEDPADPSRTTRVLTIMYADEY